MQITSNRFSELFNEAATESGIAVLESLSVEKFNFAAYLKQKMEQLQTVTLLCLDVSALSNTPEETLLTLSQFRMLYEKARIILFAPGRGVGDPFLNEVFSLGIYDIIAFVEEPDEDYLKRELVQCLLEGKTFRDSSKYKTLTETSTGKVGKTGIREIEKVVIRREIHQSVNKAQIGWMGTQSRIGTTHQCLVCASFLVKRGYRVAVVENRDNPYKCFASIQESYEDVEAGEGCFRLNNIDFYPDYNFEDIANVHSKNYNFVLLDFGTFEERYLPEFRRCVLQIIVTGSKAWEMPALTPIFEAVPEEELKEYLFLFNFTATENAKDIREGMSVLHNVFFAGYTPDPLQGVFYPDLERMLESYLSTPKGKERGKGAGTALIEEVKKFVWKKET